MKISYNWLQNYFDDKLSEPEKISEAIIFHAFEVEEIEKKVGDAIFEIKILPDRAHDCLSHWGIAKELSAVLGLKMKEQNYEVFAPKSTDLKVEIEDPKCLRYMGRIVRNITIGPSPVWLKEKLEAIGQKSINNIVDAANFVMFDLGQPIHAFDLDKLDSAKIVVRNAKNDEQIITLDKKEVNLDESILIIADEKDPLAIAGIKGGIKAEVDNNTKNIVIEVANFNATTTRKSAKKINIQTDAVKRFENEITPELCEKAVNAITDLILKLAGGEVEDVVDIYSKRAEQKEVSVSGDYINKRLGTSFSKEQIESVWNRLNFSFTENSNIYNIKVPYLRLDITGPHDLTEEVGRILGYDKIEEKIPSIKFGKKINEIYYKTLWARNKLLSEGYSEVMTYTFQSKGKVEVLASASNKKFLRANLSDGLKESYELNKLNAPLLGLDQVKIFEIGTVFRSQTSEVSPQDVPRSDLLAARSLTSEQIHVAYADKKGVTEKTLEEFCQGVEIKNSYDDLLNLSTYQLKNLQTKFTPWSLFPFITRDISVWVTDENAGSELFEIIKNNSGELLIQEPRLVDKFSKDGKISFAYRMVFQSMDRTLTDEEVNDIMVKIYENIKKNHPDWEIR
ncbi:MAG: Phenylalanine-tRNA ligase beta subunit [Candidatus Nomurabacteria bacterium GW2011_GWB1_37_5]|uniref:Phenylalanine--tRNA ligase beta subunit n=1 Tax=Candidatus Nomurabacteria bacterium GW2011_GWB1_37_5 TaxID=1618742 RepID=A0A0G0GXH5_9BACT|nr:MAG: Phenylalanine-tRNA ligase beta subunit [Candidatus Nomurabacteria bacterium GW2011_GWB1_37_5]